MILLSPLSAAAEEPVVSASISHGEMPQISFDVDGENALNLCDYSRAETVFKNRLDSLNAGDKGSLREAGLRAGYFEALLWQGRLNEAQNELKRLLKILDSLPGASSASESDTSRTGASRTGASRAGADRTGANQAGANPTDLSNQSVELLRARVLDGQSWLEQGLGNNDRALSVLDSAVKLLEQDGIKHYETWRLVTCLSHEASLKAANGDYAQASSLLAEALKQSTGSPTIAPLNIADTEEALGGTLYRMGSSDAAIHFARALSIKNQSGALHKPYSPKPYWLEPVYRYVEGSPWSGTVFQDGVNEQVIDVDGVRVQCGIVRDKTASNKNTVLRVFINVFNCSNTPLQLMGRKPELAVLAPKVVLASMIEPLKLADTVEQKAQKKAKWVRFWGQDATQSLTSTYINPPVYGYGYGYGSGFYPPVVSYGGTFPFVSRSGNMTMVTTQVPDYAAQQRAMEKARNIEDKGQAYAQDIRSQSLGPCTIAPGQKLSGAIFFAIPATKEDGKYFLGLPVGDSLMQFRIQGAPQL